VDVTKTFPRKVAALRAHVSQTGQRDDLEDLLRQRLASTAQRAGLPEGHLAEAFRVVDTA
jgi:LmbE family N-acetylglucosaminyl deacetylase